MRHWKNNLRYAVVYPRKCLTKQQHYGCLDTVTTWWELFGKTKSSKVNVPLCPSTSAHCLKACTKLQCALARRPSGQNMPKESPMNVSRTELWSSLNKRQQSTCDQHHLITWITWRTRRPRALLKKYKFKSKSRERTHTFLFENNPKRACSKCIQEHPYHRQIGGRPRSRERAAANQMPKEWTECCTCDAKDINEFSNANNPQLGEWCTSQGHRHIQGVREL